MMHNEYYRWIIKYIFMRNLFGDTDLDIICYKFSQTYKSLTQFKPRMTFFFIHDPTDKISIANQIIGRYIFKESTDLLETTFS